MNAGAQQVAVDRDRIRATAAAEIAKGKRFARRGALVGVVTLAVIELFVAIPVAISPPRPEDVHGLAWAGIAIFLGIGGLLFVSLRMLFMRDVHQLEALITQGEPHKGTITSRTFVVETVTSGPSNMTVVWDEHGRDVNARMNDRGSVIDGPVDPHVVVLTRGRRRWVGVVVGQKLLLALRPPREYHLWGNK